MAQLHTEAQLNIPDLLAYFRTMSFATSTGPVGSLLLVRYLHLPTLAHHPPTIQKIQIQPHNRSLATMASSITIPASHQLSTITLLHLSHRLQFIRLSNRANLTVRWQRMSGCVNRRPVPRDRLACSVCKQNFWASKTFRMSKNILEESMASSIASVAAC